MIECCVSVNDGETVKITLYKDPWILCDTERYLEKVAVNCRGVRAELLSRAAIGQ